MGQEKRKEREAGEKAESKLEKNESKFAVFAHGPNFGSWKFASGTEAREVFYL